MKQEEWINSVMTSIDQLESVSPPPDLFAKIERQINQDSTKVIPLNWVIGMAASLLVLVFMNVTALQTNKDDQQTSNTLELVGSQMDSSNQLY